MPRFRLSTLFLGLVVCALLLGWYVDRLGRHRDRAMVGVWHYPTPDRIILGYVSRLEIRSDGTFTKTQSGNNGGEVFEGTWTVVEDGSVSFHVTSCDVEGRVGVSPRGLNALYSCRCAIDPAGYLVIDVISDSESALEGRSRIQWETCVRERP